MSQHLDSGPGQGGCEFFEYHIESKHSLQWQITIIFFETTFNSSTTGARAVTATTSLQLCVSQVTAFQIENNSNGIWQRFIQNTSAEVFIKLRKEGTHNLHISAGR
jgi:hypothetical protein